MGLRLTTPFLCHPGRDLFRGDALVSGVRLSRQSIVGLVVGLTIVCLLPGWMCDDPRRLALLTHPAAWLAGHLVAVPVGLSPGEPPLLMHPLFLLRVVEGCSGSDFFGLLTGLLVWVSLRLRPRLVWLAPLAAYLMTVIANAGRLVAVLVSESFLASRLPDYLHGSLHAATGIAVFLPLLIATYLVWERMITYAHKPL